MLDLLRQLKDSCTAAPGKPSEFEFGTIGPPGLAGLPATTERYSMGSPTTYEKISAVLERNRGGSVVLSEGALAALEFLAYPNEVPREALRRAERNNRLGAADILSLTQQNEAAATKEMRKIAMELWPGSVMVSARKGITPGDVFQATRLVVVDLPKGTVASTKALELVADCGYLPLVGIFRDRGRYVVAGVTPESVSDALVAVRFKTAVIKLDTRAVPPMRVADIKSADAMHGTDKYCRIVAPTERRGRESVVCYLGVDSRNAFPVHPTHERGVFQLPVGFENGTCIHAARRILEYQNTHGNHLIPGVIGIFEVAARLFTAEDGAQRVAPMIAMERAQPLTLQALKALGPSHAFFATLVRPLLDAWAFLYTQLGVGYTDISANNVMLRRRSSGALNPVFIDVEGEIMMPPSFTPIVHRSSSDMMPYFFPRVFGFSRRLRARLPTLIGERIVFTLIVPWCVAHSDGADSVDWIHRLNAELQRVLPRYKAPPRLYADPIRSFELVAGAVVQTVPTVALYRMRGGSYIRATKRADRNRAAARRLAAEIRTTLRSGKVPSTTPIYEDLRTILQHYEADGPTFPAFAEY